MENPAIKARNYLDARRGERVTLGELAAAVGVSRFHLQRRFKEAFGVEEFRFNASGDPAVIASKGASNDAPGIGPLALLGVLGIALLAMRRRS